MGSSPAMLFRMGLPPVTLALVAYLIVLFMTSQVQGESQGKAILDYHIEGYKIEK